jgi:CheY-like chemotaxis protein
MGVRVLVVDDNRDAADMLATALRVFGHEAVVAHDGEEALALLGDGPCDAAVLDIGLPVMDGLELARRIRKQPRVARLFLIALSGHGLDEDRERSLAAGFDLHLVKPVDLDTLQRAIARCEKS